MRPVRGGGDGRSVSVNHTIYIPSGEFNHTDIIGALETHVGENQILAMVNTTGNWHITLKEGINLENLCLNGIGINGNDIEVKLVARNILTVSFMGVPYYVTNEMLSSKLRDFGVKTNLSPWIRKKFQDYPDIESGIVHCRIDLPENIKSLPYATRICDVNILIKHNNQVKVCNYCLCEGHLMRSCPEKLRCHFCGLIGHLRAACPDREEVDEATMSGSSVSGDEDDEISLHSFGENTSNWDGSSGESDDDSTKSLVIDESRQPEDTVQRPQHQDSQDNADGETAGNASTSKALAAKHRGSNSKRGHFSTSTSDDDVGDDASDPDWVPHSSKKSRKKSKKTEENVMTNANHANYANRANSPIPTKNSYDGLQTD